MNHGYSKLDLEPYVGRKFRFAMGKTKYGELDGQVVRIKEVRDDGVGRFWLSGRAKGKTMGKLRVLCLPCQFGEEV